MKTFVWDRGWCGAYVMVAPSAEEAIQQWHQANPNGLYNHHRQRIAPTVEALVEVLPNSYHVTTGDD